MIQIGNAIVSFSLFEKFFLCDLIKCKGECCVQGDSGAPLEKEEVKLLDDIVDKVKPYMQPAGVDVVESIGNSVIDTDGDLVTPLINGKECAFTYFEKGIAKCAIEKAYLEKIINFRKPVSCHLYPIRITAYPTFEAVNYHEWKLCECALEKGLKEQLPLYVFLKEPLIRKFGSEWYKELEIANIYKNSSIK